VGKFDLYSLAYDRAYENMVADVYFSPSALKDWTPGLEIEQSKWGLVSWQQIEEREDLQDFWLHTAVVLGEDFLAHKKLLLVLAGDFRAETHWNGQRVGSKDRTNIDGAGKNAPLFLTSFEVSSSFVNVGRNNVDIEVSRTDEFIFAKPFFQIFSINALTISWLDYKVHDFLVGFIFLSLSFFVVVFALTFNFEIFEKHQGKALLILSVSLVINFILMFFVGLFARAVNVSMVLYVTTFIVIVVCLEFIFPYLWETARRRAIQLGLVGGLFVIALLFANNIYQYFLILQFVAFGLLVLNEFWRKELKIDFSSQILSVFFAFLIFAIYKPYFIAKYGIYFVFIIWLLPVGFQQFRAFLWKIGEKKKYLSIYSSGRKQLIPIAEIQYMDAKGNYTKITLFDKTTYFYQYGISEALARLPNSFVRVHRSHVINLKYVDSLLTKSGSNYQILLSTGQILPVGRVYLREIRRYLA